MGLGGLFFKVIDLPRVIFFSQHNMGFSGGSVVQNLPAKQETPVQSLGQEDPLEKRQPSILAWRIPWAEEPHALYIVYGVTESDTTEHACMCTHSEIQFCVKVYCKF